MLIAEGYSTNDPRLATRPSKIVDEYEQLDSVAEEFDRFVQPNVSQADWIAERKSDRQEIERLGDLLTFYDHKPQLNEFEQRAYKRLLRQDRAMQTDRHEQTPVQSARRSNLPIPKIRLPVPSAMEKVEEFLATNQWRLIDLFKSMDKEKSWRIAKDDFLRFIQKVEQNETSTDQISRRSSSGTVGYQRRTSGRTALLLLPRIERADELQQIRPGTIVLQAKQSR